MEKYIGIKIIDAECGNAPKQFGEYKKGTPGMKVVYGDGYTSWSPQDVFDNAYRRIDNMTFGLAIEAMKKGFKVARKGWNGKGMFIYLVEGSLLHPNMLKNECAKHLLPVSEGTRIRIGSHIDMKAADGSVVIGWLASQTDLLAEDWKIVE